MPSQVLKTVPVETRGCTGRCYLPPQPQLMNLHTLPCAVLCHSCPCSGLWDLLRMGHARTSQMSQSSSSALAAADRDHERLCKDGQL